MVSHLYHAYGLTIGSEIALPGLLPVEGVPEATIQIVNDGREPRPANLMPFWEEFDRARAVLCMPVVGRFVIEGGRTVTVTLNQGADEHALRLNLAGIVLAALLYQRGFFVMHASAVAIGGRAVAIAGESGMGKSTLAAALHARGHRFVSDDVVVISPAGPSPVAYPGYPQAKLHPEMITRMGSDGVLTSELHPLEPKRAWALHDGFDSRPLPLGRVYILADGDDRIEARPVTPSQAFLELVRNSYPTRLQFSGGADHFLQSGRLAAALPFYYLARSLATATPLQLAQFVEDHLKATPAAAQGS